MKPKSKQPVTAKLRKCDPSWDIPCGSMPDIDDQLDRIESKLDRLLGENPKAVEEQGLEHGDYIEASQEVVDELDRLGFKWNDVDRTRFPHIGFMVNGRVSNSHWGGPYQTHRPDFLDRARVTAKKLGLVPKEAPKPTTIKGWLETLPEPYRTQALGVMDAIGANNSCSALSLAVGRIRFLDLTPQGSSYWLAVYEWAKNPTNNPLPEPWVAPAKEPWVPKVGEWVTLKPIAERRNGTLGCAMEVGTHKVLTTSTTGSNRTPSYGLVHNSGGTYLYTVAENLRPATPEEIATKEREDKLSKLVFGAKVCTPHGDGMYHYRSNIGFGYDHWVVFSNGERSNYGIDQITPL